MKRKRWASIAAMAAGLMLMAYSGPLAHTWTSAYLATSLPIQVDWLLPIGLVAMVGGGFLVQTTWETRHG